MRVKLAIPAGKCELKNFEATLPGTMFIVSRIDFGADIGSFALVKSDIMSESAGKTILYIEDDPIILMAYRTRLVQEGFHVVPAMDGLEAMRLLTQFVPDAVILDLMLPKFNGEEILKFIRAKPALAKIPVVLLSTHSIIDAKSEPVLETAHRRLIKDTCTPAVMLEAVRSALV